MPMSTTVSLPRLVDALLPAVVAAGRIQMQYFQQSPEVETKKNNTPVTVADRLSEEFILKALAAAAGNIPVIAEESAALGSIPQIGEEFFLVDPLDGTRDYIAGRPDFTVNIGLIAKGQPVFGLIYAPAREALFMTDPATGAAMAGSLSLHDSAVRCEMLGLRRIHARRVPGRALTVATSQSHPSAAVEDFLKCQDVGERLRMGSSIKFCLIAEGRADLYPRFKDTCEWDTAAGQAILEAAGGSVVDTAGASLTYGHSERSFINPHFIAWGERAA